MILYFIHSFVVHVTLLLLTNFDCVILTIDALLQITIYTPEKFVIVENLRLVCLLDLTADFGVKTNTKLTPKCQLRERERAKLVFRAVCTAFLRKFPDVYSLICNFSATYILSKSLNIHNTTQ